MFYSSLQSAEAEPMYALQQAIPVISQRLCVSGQKQVLLIQTELNAGRNAVDITNASAAQAFGIKKAGALDPYLSPQRQFFATGHKDKEGYFTPTYINPVVLGFNTNMIKRAAAPKRYEELLEPKWKSNMILDIEEFPWFAVLLKHYGREKGLDYMKRLARQDVLMSRGRTTQAQLICAGERAIGIALNIRRWWISKSGRAIEWTILDPTMPNPTCLSGQARPNARSRAVMTGRYRKKDNRSGELGYIVARKGVKKPSRRARKGQLLCRSGFIGPILKKPQRFSQCFCREVVSSLPAQPLRSESTS